MYKDPELILLRNRFLLGLGVALIFAIPIALLFFNRFRSTYSDVYSAFRRQESFIIFMTDSSNCSNCSAIEQLLKEQEVAYYSYDISKEKDYDDVQRRIGITSSALKPPAIIYIQEGQMEANLLNISKEQDALLFLENYGLDHTLE